jgi:hypothetical protein
MPTLDDRVLGLSGRLTHQFDYTFYKNNGEIANRIRTALTEKGSQPGGSVLKYMSIDADGDIEVQMDRGSFYASPVATVFGGWSTEWKNIATSRNLEELSRMVELISDTKGSFARDGYSIRVILRFTPEDGLRMLKSRFFDSTLESMLGAKTPAESKSIRFSTKYTQGVFSASLEVEASEDIQVRCTRDASAASFDSYGAFLHGIDLQELLDDLRPLAEFLASNERRLVGRVLGERKRPT